MKKIFLLFAVSISIFSSCKETESVSPNESKFANIQLAEKEETEIEKFGRELKFDIKRNTEINSKNGLEFKTLQAAKSFLKMTKQKILEEEMLVFLEENTTNFKEYYRKNKKNSKSFKIKGNESFSTTNTGCGNWNNAINFHTPFTAISTLHLSANISNGNINSISSYISGWILGTSWHRGFFTSNRYSNTIESWIYGTKNWTLFYEGIGIIFSEPVAYRVHIQCNGQVTIDEIKQ